MKILIVGLGSMGKRRIRCLKALGEFEIYGFDNRSDRLNYAKEKYNINIVDEIDDFNLKNELDALIISTSPESHMHYAFWSLNNNIPCFIEASVTDSHLIKELSEKISKRNLIIAPSCTMKYYKGPKIIKKLLKEKVIGKPIYINYKTGQYLPDWHPWEDISDFYVSKRITGGCREIVPFELTWLNDLFGHPIAINSVIKNTNNLKVDIDDYYNFSLSYPNDLIANITIEVISRPFALREFRLTGTDGQIVFSQDENCVRYANITNKEWVKFSLDNGFVEPGYINPEKPYVDEMIDFLEAVNNSDQTLFPNNLEKDYKVLSILNELEKINLIKK